MNKKEVLRIENSMDWAGFARSVRQTIDSVMFLC